MSLLIPQSPGHWTEVVLMAFPEAQLTNDAPVPGILHVTLVLAPDLEIEFRRDEFTLDPDLAVFSANLLEYNEVRGLESEAVLVESSDLELLLEHVREWVDGYYRMMVSLAATETLDDLGWGK